MWILLEHASAERAVAARMQPARAAARGPGSRIRGAGRRAGLPAAAVWYELREEAVHVAHRDECARILGAIAAAHLLYHLAVRVALARRVGPKVLGLALALDAHRVD